MDKKDISDKIARLREEIREHNRRYYVDNAPVISDFEYDIMMSDLANLEKMYPEFASADSPTVTVGSDLEGAAREFVQREHRYPMLSLGNTYDISEVEAFFARTGLARGEYTLSAELKFDGTAICLTYRNGRLVQALTRGDGTKGDDVTANVRKISNIPVELTPSAVPFPEEFEIRGEIYMPYEAFDRLNQERELNEEPPFANPRNAASGSLKLLDPKEVARRGLECTLYHMVGDNLPFATHIEALTAAAGWGLPVSEHVRLCRSVAEAEEYIKEWDTRRKFLPFATDGIVVKINELALQKQLGYTAKSPRWATAFKFQAERALTRLVSIDYQVGRTGAVTPVANLEPVQLSGTVVKRASLHNEDQIRLHDIHIGDYVYVEKGGEIIPKITGVELSKRTSDRLPPDFPVSCPVCGTPLVRPEGEARYFCPNQDSCPPQIKAKLLHFAGRKAMDINAGEATVEQLYDASLVRSPEDFYYLAPEQLLKLEGWKQKSVDKFLKSVDKSRQVPYERVLFALGIRHVGETTAKLVAKKFRSIDALAGATREELLETDEIGETIADSIVAYFTDVRHLDSLVRLREAGLRFEAQGGDAPVSGELAGRSFVISGNFTVPRDDMKEYIASHGGRLAGSVSGKTDFLVAGAKSGPEKLRKASQLGVKVISEDELRQMVAGAKTEE